VRALLSNDLPRSRALSAVLLVITAAIVLTPFVFSGATSLNVAAKICVFIILVASYDALLGYTGIVSLAHTMFYGIGAYGVGIALYGMGPTWAAIGVGAVAALAIAIVLSLLIGLFSLRVRAIFFAMITLAVASAFLILASQLSDLTGGEDGRTFRVPELLRRSYRLVEGDVLGVSITGRLVLYYLIVVVTIAVFLLLLRMVNSPFGRVLQAIRENPFRAEALGYRTVVYRSLANVIAAACAAVAGMLWALWLGYTGPNTTLSFAVMLDILLMVVIGGMGTLYGSVIGAAIFILAENYLQVPMQGASEATAGLPLLPNLLHPDRWLLWLGVLFVLSVYFFPTGIVGRLRSMGGKS
jgi:branched-chain amino acid transport system permease protein